MIIIAQRHIPHNLESSAVIEAVVAGTCELKSDFTPNLLTRSTQSFGIRSDGQVDTAAGQQYAYAVAYRLYNSFRTET